MNKLPDLYEGNRLADAGIRSEKIIAEWLWSNPTKIDWFGSIKEVHNYTITKDRDKQLKGIDYSITCTSGILYRPEKIIYADCKTDTHLGVSDNLLFELGCIKNDKYATNGWGIYSKSDFVLFHAVSVSKIYVVYLPTLRHYAGEFIKGNLPEAKLNYISYFQGKGMMNILIPMKYLESVIQIYEM